MEQEKLDSIRQKNLKGEKLTLEEEFVYLTKILRYDEEEANRIIAITENKDKFTIID